MFKSKKLAVLAALLSLMMLFSAFAVPAFAEETEAPTDVTETTAVEETTAEGDTEAATEAGTGNESEKETTGSATTGSTTTGSTTTGSDNKGDNGDKDYTGIINLCVGAVILIVLAILCIKFRAKIPAWWKGLKSECGKITWCPKDKMKKNTFVVIIIIIAIAAIIGVLDFVFSKGLVLLRDLFQ